MLAVDPFGLKVILLEIAKKEDSEDYPQSVIVHHPRFEGIIKHSRDYLKKHIKYLLNKYPSKFFEKLVRKGLVTVDGKAYKNPNMYDFIEMLIDERNSEAFIQVSGTLNDAIKKMKKEIGKNENEWDQYLFLVHGVYRYTYNGRVPTGTSPTGKVDIHGEHDDQDIVVAVLYRAFNNAKKAKTGVISCGQYGYIEVVHIKSPEIVYCRDVDGDGKDDHVIDFTPMKVDVKYRKVPRGRYVPFTPPRHWASPATQPTTQPTTQPASE